MSVLLLRLAGPMQSWGDSSQFIHRDTRRYPTKSGVLGLLAAAQGRRRVDPVEDLANLRFGVRVDQPGTIMSDFHTAHTKGFDKPPVVSYRQYLTDAVFVAGVEGEAGLITALGEAVQRPSFPLFLGRRSCPVEGQLYLGQVDGPLDAALASVPWQASEWHRRRRNQHTTLPLYLDGGADQLGAATKDVPISYSSAHRQYGWRNVVETEVPISNEDLGTRATRGDDFPNWFDWSA